MNSPTHAAGPNILVVSGSSQQQNRCQTVAAVAADIAKQAGGQVRKLDLAHIHLPMMTVGDSAQGELPLVKQVREDAAWAQGFILVTPEYHGAMSGVLKNWFDFLYPELAGKFAGVLATTGGGGGDMSITNVKAAFNWCHGFTLPFHAAVRRADFADDGSIAAPVLDRVQRLAYDVVRYCSVVGSAFAAAQQAGPGVESGVAGLHA